MPTASTPRGTLAYDVHEVDEAAPTLLYIHGAGGTRKTWQAELRHPPGYNAYFIDLVGHGESPMKNGNLLSDSIADYTMDVISFLDTVGLEKPIWCGYSMGAAMALLAALDFSAYIRGIVSICGSANMVFEWEMVDAVGDELGRAIKRIWALLRKGGEGSGDLASYKQFLELDDRVLVNDYNACYRFDVEWRLNQIDIPVLAIGSDGDEVFTLEDSRYLAEHIKNAKLVTVTDAGHFLPAEKPEAVYQLIQDWLAEQSFTSQG